MATLESQTGHLAAINLKTGKPYGYHSEKTSIERRLRRQLSPKTQASLPEGPALVPELLNLRSTFGVPDGLVAIFDKTTLLEVPMSDSEPQEELEVSTPSLETRLKNFGGALLRVLNLS